MFDRKNRIRLFSGASILVFLMLTMGLAWAGGHGHRSNCVGDPDDCIGGGPFGMHHRGMGHGPLFENLDLTDEQKAQIETILQSHRDGREANQEQARELHETLADLIHADGFDEAAVSQVAEEMAAMHAERIVERARVHNEILQLLTPEQIAELEELREEHGAFMQGDKPRGGNFGDRHHRRHR